VVGTRSDRESRRLIRGGRLREGAADRPSEPVDVRLRGGRIAEIRSAGTLVPSADEIVHDAHGRLVMPGLVNAHFHSTGTFNRAFVDNLPLELFMLFELPPFDFGPFPGELYRAQAQWAAAQMLRVGVTSVMDDAMFYPGPDDDTIDALMGAYDDSGIRASVALYLPNKVEYEWIPGLRELLPDDVVERMGEQSASTDDLVALYERFIERWHGRDGGRLGCALSCSAPQRATDDYMARLHRLSSERRLPFMFHIYETKLQRAAADSFFGGSMVRHLRKLGILDERSVVVHAVWVDDEDIRDLAECGAVVVHSPCGNLRCGSGVMPYRALRDAGVRVALCTDEATVEDRCNLWQVGRVAGMLQTAGGPDYTAWPRAAEIVDAMTAEGGRCFGPDGELGVLREGAHADVILLDLDAVLEMPLARLPTALVYGEDGSSVRDVFVAGRHVVRDGTVTTIDPERLRREVAQWAGVWADSVEPVERWAARLLPAYRELHERFANLDIGINRWVGDEGRWLAAGPR
jgi:5-methylthioadenosine/S-adenosylhomocysteine deaminase